MSEHEHKQTNKQDKRIDTHTNHQATEQPKQSNISNNEQTHKRRNTSTIEQTYENRNAETTKQISK